MKIPEIIQNASEFGLKIGKLDDFDEKVLEDMCQSIIEYKKNRYLVHPIDYLW
ncbi:hypothetical protein YTPLAS73_00120 [Nitrosarchaeum sp.]|nr:hypothetical protein YTPLAS73_00120 [Nitrosarchaeum sp.]